MLPPLDNKVIDRWVEAFALPGCPMPDIPAHIEIIRVQHASPRIYYTSCLMILQRQYGHLCATQSCLFAQDTAVFRSSARCSLCSLKVLSINCLPRSARTSAASLNFRYPVSVLGIQGRPWAISRPGSTGRKGEKFATNLYFFL